MDAEDRQKWLQAFWEELVELVADSLQLDEYVKAQVSLVSTAVFRLELREEVELRFHSSIKSLAADPPTRWP
jgi:uncharacterized protein HemX